MSLSFARARSDRFVSVWAVLSLVGFGLFGTGFCQVVPVTNFADVGRSVQRSTISEYDGSLFFGVGVNESSERELWSFDGTRPKLISNGFIGDSEIAVDEFTEFQGQLYFTANRGEYGQELYRFDGQTVSLAADVQPGPESSFPVNLVVHNDTLFFSGKHHGSFNNLWAFDGSNLSRITGFEDPRASIVTGVTYKDDLYFGADDGERGMELWKYDGNSVSHVADVEPGPDDSFPRDFTVVGDTMFFKTNSKTKGQEVWQYDGNTVSILADVNPGLKSSDPRVLTNVDGKLMFSAVAYGQRSVYLQDDDGIVRKVVDGGGPIEINDELYTVRGRDENGVEINDLYGLDGAFHRTTVSSAGPFATLDDDLYFSCDCEQAELFMLAEDGDADSDGVVAFGDFLSLADNFGTGKNWRNGDFNHDGRVTFGDFVMQADNFGGVPLATDAELAAVPEPTSLQLLFASVLTLAVIRRKRRG